MSYGERSDLRTRAVLVAAFSQLAALLIQDFGVDTAGHALEVSPVNALMLQVPLYLAGLLVIAALWALVRAVLPVGRRILDTLGVLVLALLIVATVVDFGLQRFRAERLSWNHLTTYGTGDVNNSEWIAPLLESPAAVVAMLATLALGVTGLAVVWWQGRAAVEPKSGGRSLQHAALFATGALACYLPTRFAYYHQRDMARPPQAALLDGVLAKPKVWDVADEAAARTQWRAHLSAAGGDSPGYRWLTDSFPLWHSGTASRSLAFGAAALDPPDILIFMIESLRGRDVGWGFGPRKGESSLTPHLDSLAREGVAFPHHVSGGEPSPRGFIVLQTGVWEHGQLFIVANRPNTHIDALPLRLRKAGYYNLAFWGGNPSFDNQLTWARRWYDEVVFDLPENRLFYYRTMPDRVLMDRVIDRINAHDLAHASQPLFAYIASGGTHTPYDLEDSAAVAPDFPPSADRQRRYDLVLRNADAQVGRVIARLRTRPRWRNTVVIVVGDHSDRTTEQGDARWRGMPTDALVATSALVYGPRRLIGEPRTIVAATSHVDILPTVLSWLGDTSAVSTMGRDLFDTTSAATREAVSINSRGYRLDRGGYTLLVDSRDSKSYGTRASATGRTS